MVNRVLSLVFGILLSVQIVAPAFPQATWIGQGQTVVPERSNHAMVFDPVRNVIVLHGGTTRYSVACSGNCTSTYYPGVRLGDTWEWDGAAWAQVATGPTAAIAEDNLPSLAYDPDRGVVVGNVDGDISEWDGTNWQRFSTAGPVYFLANSPNPGRVVFLVGAYALEWDGAAFHIVAQYPGRPVAPNFTGAFQVNLGPLASCYDPVRNVTVFVNADGGVHEWDGVSFRSHPGSWSPIRQGATAVYDHVQEGVLLLGGSLLNGAPVETTDTLLWKGAGWIDLGGTAANGLSLARRNAAGATDPATGRPLVFGGYETIRGFHCVSATTSCRDTLYAPRQDFVIVNTPEGNGQANSAMAALRINGAGAASFSGPFDLCLLGGRPATLTWRGPPGATCALYAGPLSCPPSLFPCIGSLDIGTPPTHGDARLLIDGTMDPRFILDAMGNAEQTFVVPPFPGFLDNLQGLVFQPAGASCGVTTTAAFHDDRPVGGDVLLSADTRL